MSNTTSANKRLSQLFHHLNGSPEQLSVVYETRPKHHQHRDDLRHKSLFLLPNATAAKKEKGIFVRIGTVSVPLAIPKDNTLVPAGYLFPLQTEALTTSQQLGGLSKRQDLLAGLQFIMKKQLLGQDIFLIGPPGPTSRCDGILRVNAARGRVLVRVARRDGI